MTRKKQQEEGTTKLGKLIRTYRHQHGWTQKQLAEKWGYTREYVSLVEKGTRRLERDVQVAKLAEILEIPLERLEAIGRGRTKGKPAIPKVLIVDDFSLQVLLESAKASVKLSWLVQDTNNIDDKRGLAL